MENLSSTKKGGGPSYASNRDLRILNYLWRWKVAPSLSIHTMLGENTPYSNYKALEKLERLGFIKSEYIWKERFYVWTLTKKGFEAIRHGLGELKEEGFSSEYIAHDRMVLAFQLGDWVGKEDPRVQFFTEQELRRYEMARYPSWVPKLVHRRPDGYTRIVGLKKTEVYAIEVELSTKSASRYESTMRLYQNRSVQRVFWLVGNDYVKNQILQAKSEVRDSSLNFHVFVDLRDFEKNGSDALVSNERSQTLFSLRENTQGILGELPCDTAENIMDKQRLSVHLDKLKVIGKTRR